MMILSEAEARVAIIKAMLHPLCLPVIVFLLKGGEHAFSEIFNFFDSINPQSSRQLVVLKEAGIILS
jgi:hypothetical protein